MAAQDNLSDQFITVYRGRSRYWGWESPKTEEDLKGLGMHWTTDLGVARHFASGWNDSDSEPDHRTGKRATELGGHVLYGKVHRQHVVEQNTPEWKRLAKEHAIIGDDDGVLGEKEVTLRKNAPIEVTGLEEVRNRRDAMPRQSNRYIIRKNKTFQGGMGTV